MVAPLAQLGAMVVDALADLALAELPVERAGEQLLAERSDGLSRVGVLGDAERLLDQHRVASQDVGPALAVVPADEEVFAIAATHAGDACVNQERLQPITASCCAWPWRSPPGPVADARP